MNFGAILESAMLSGDAKRCFELGNALVDKGLQFTVFTKDGKAPDWMDFRGAMGTWKGVETANLDLLFACSARLMQQVIESSARRKVLYHCHPDDKNVDLLMADPQIEIWAPSSQVAKRDQKKHERADVEVFGGLNVSDFTPKTDYKVGERPFVVLVNGNLAKRHKGTRLVVGACESLYKKGLDLKILLFAAPQTKKEEQRLRKFECQCPFEFIKAPQVASDIYCSADIFVSAEHSKHTGWNTTVAEAMACALPVLTTKAGTSDLIVDGENGLRCWRWGVGLKRGIRKLYDSNRLREMLGKNARETVEEFDWSHVAETIISHYGIQVPQLTSEQPRELPQAVPAPEAETPQAPETEAPAAAPEAAETAPETPVAAPEEPAAPQNPETPDSNHFNVTYSNINPD